MSYGLIYYGEFDSRDSLLTYRANIFKKGYTGEEQVMLMSDNPAIHEWQEDDPKAPIKGASFKLGIVADHGQVGFVNLHLNDFFSNNDDEYLLEFIRKETDEVLFTGYLVQSDCAEVQLDWAHEVVLSFTDNIGLLKNITLLEAAQAYGQTAVVPITALGTSGLTGDEFLTIGSDTVDFYPGQQFTITSGACAGTYTFISVEYNSTLASNIIFVVEALPAFVTPYGTNFSYIVTFDVTAIRRIREILYLCLKATNLSLPTKVLSELYPIGGTAGRWIDSTYINGRSFKDDSYMSCYDVLEQIMMRFNATFFQARGSWNIVRWGESYNMISVDGLDFRGYSYDENMSAIGSITVTDNFNIGNGSDIVSGWIKSIVRPFKYAQETFNYVQLPNTIENADLRILGNFITSYNAGGNGVFEYELPGWYDLAGSPGPFPTRYIRVTYDGVTGQELERIIVLTGAAFNTGKAIESNEIMVDQDDIINYSFDVKSDVSQPGPVNLAFFVGLNDGTNTYFLNQFGQWVLPPTPNGIILNVGAGDNTNQWHNVSISSGPAPVDGIMKLYLAEITASTANESHYRNFSLEIVSYVGGSGKVIGHTHKKSQPLETKNIDAKTITMDDGPLRSKKGCLFLSTFTGILRNKTTEWSYDGYAGSFTHPLGYITTFEDAYQNSYALNKFNGTILQLKGIDTANIISPRAVFKYGIEGALSGSRFVTGALSINYMDATADLTLYDITNEDYTPAQFEGISLYNFSYIYETN
jgi:hypothetical protein